MLRTEFQFRCTEHALDLIGTPRFTIANEDHSTFKVELGSMHCPGNIHDACKPRWTDRACDHMRRLREDLPRECHSMTCWNYSGKWFAGTLVATLEMVIPDSSAHTQT